VSNRVSRRQGQRWAEQEQQQYYDEPAPAPAPPAPAPVAPVPAPAAAPTDRIAALQQLGELHASGVLTDAEFEAEKARVLAT